MMYSKTRSKKGRGMAQRSLDLIEAMHAVTEAAQPITGRGVGDKLFTPGLIASMQKSDRQRVYRLLKEAREQGITEQERATRGPSSNNGATRDEGHRCSGNCARPERSQER